MRAEEKRREEEKYMSLGACQSGGNEPRDKDDLYFMFAYDMGEDRDSHDSQESM